MIVKGKSVYNAIIGRQTLVVIRQWYQCIIIVSSFQHREELKYSGPTIRGLNVLFFERKTIIREPKGKQTMTEAGFPKGQTFTIDILEI